MISSTGDSVLLGKLIGASMAAAAVGTDQAITMSAGLANGSAWFVENVVLANPSVDANGFAAIIDTAINQGGQTVASWTIGSAGIVAPGKAATVAGMNGPNTINPNKIASVITANTGQLHVTHAGALGGTVDVYLYGRVVSGQ